jgi:trehalose 6-phosphate phosphatase
VAVHTRRATDPDGAFRALLGPLRDLAGRHGLVLEPGRLVLEVRPAGVDKGVALTEYVRATGAGTVLYAGDDLGDLPAFAAVERLRAEGVAGLLVCSGSAEVTELADRADLVVDGPEGVVRLLRALASQLD